MSDHPELTIRMDHYEHETCLACGQAFDPDTWTLNPDLDTGWLDTETYECPEEDCNGRVSLLE